MKPSRLSFLICLALLPPAWAAEGMAAAEKPVLRLSMSEAVEIALGVDGNARVRAAREIMRQAEARSSQARAALLPNIDASVGQLSQTRNLEAFGLRIQLPVPGVSIPAFVGPFNVFDARVTAAQSLFDMAAIQRYRASRAGTGLAQAEKESAEDQTRDLAAKSYLNAQRAAAALKEARANLALSEALVRLAENQKAAGTGTGIEVTRARVQLSHQRQRLLAAENGLNRARFQLLRVMGLDLDVALELTENLGLPPTEKPAPATALEAALAARADWRAGELRREGARLQASAVKLERLPSVGFFADYGSIGSGPGNALPTRSYGVQVRVPLFDGGRRDARRAESDSLLRQEEIRMADLRRQIDFEIRTALDSLSSAELQVKAAEEGLALAETELAQAERRYRAGMGSSIEVTDAQTRLERARENRIEALFGYNAARLDLGTATGTIREMTR